MATLKYNDTGVTQYMLAEAGRIALAAMAGAAMMYFLDPNHGRRRRAMARDRSMASIRRGTRNVERLQRHAASDAAGFAQRVTHHQRGELPAPNDVTLTHKVESVLFRDPDVPKGRININVQDGVVVLRGQLDHPEQIKALESATRDIPGVRAVENLLHLPHTPAPNKQDAMRVH